MRSIAITEKNDIFLDATGQIATVSDLAAVVQNCRTAMQAQRGEMVYDMARGMPNRATIYDRYNPVQFTAAGRATLAAVEGVVAVESFDVQRDGDAVRYSATIKTIFGIGNVNG